MPEPMTDEHLAEIRQRHEAARLGPWYRDPRSTYGAWTAVSCHDELDFALNARMDIPALLAEVDRLRAELAVPRACDCWPAYEHSEHCAIYPTSEED